MPVKHSGLPPDKWIAEAQKRLRQLPLKVANTAHRHFARNFETESWEGQKWPPRSPRAVRNEGRQLLRDTGTLFCTAAQYTTSARTRSRPSLRTDFCSTFAYISFSYLDWV